MKFLNTSECYNEPLDLWDQAIYRNNTLISKDEQCLICELIKERKPKKILEIGVYSGGTSALILHTLDLLGLPSRLYSVDLADELDIYKKVGFVANEVISPKLREDRWKLYTGCTVAKVIEEIGGDIDLLILDTAHILPGEVLDFVTVLPYLSEGAAVVCHDILYASLSIWKDWNATGILFSSVVGEKLYLQFDASESDAKGLCNIGAFIVTPDTRKYPENLFHALCLPWLAVPSQEHMEDYLAIIKKHYSKDFLYLINTAHYMSQISKLRFDYNKLLALKKSQDSSIAVWGFKGMGEQLYYSIEGKFVDCEYKEKNIKYRNALTEFRDSIYFIDNAKKHLEEERTLFYGASLCDKERLANDKKLDAVIIAALSEKSKREILSELHSMNIPDEKIHFIEDFFDDKA